MRSIEDIQADNFKLSVEETVGRIKKLLENDHKDDYVLRTSNKIIAAYLKDHPND